ncbi:MAG: hypothetical protein KAT68_14440 [Bacteroidales bacterium]|nr:hypothetical protein [Bacteroidales bacterium]
MRVKQEKFKNILLKEAKLKSKPKPKPSKKDFLKSEYADELFRTYKKLGGIMDEFPSRFRGWDVELKNVVIELDDERHFNRYRIITLGSEIYKKLDFFPMEKYLKLCKEYESICLRAATWSEKWTSYPSVDQYGEAGPEGELEGNGAPRWKQRAFYDLIRDTTQLMTDYKVIRIPIWDKIEDAIVDDIITGKRKDLIPNLIEYVKSLI